jgi:hypothetical protein
LEKIRKLETDIKEYNAIKADYKKDLEDSEAALKKKDITQQHYDKAKKKYEDLVEKMNAKIVAARKEIEELRKA